MMGISDHIAALTDRFIYQRPFPKLCTQGTGIVFLSLFHDDLPDLGMNDRKFHTKLFTISFNSCKICIGIAQIHTDGRHRKMLRIET